jgi:uncharacterized repeat protein (TIGR03803 family)
MTVSFLSHRFIRLSIAPVAIALAAATAVSAQEQEPARYDVVSSFAPESGRPITVFQTRSGQFYGTTSGPDPIFSGGTSGTVFRMDAAGARTTVHRFFAGSFTPFTSDGFPAGNLFEGSDGSVYGSAYIVPESLIPPGQIFRISPAGVYTRVASISTREGVIQARDGRLYGVVEGRVFDPTQQNFGGVFRIEASGMVALFHRFDGTETLNPVGELVEIDDGSLYGVTEGGGVLHFPPPDVERPGAIFQVDPTTGAVVIRYFFAIGIRPTGRLIQGADGRLYGTTRNGGNFGLGTVFSFDRSAGTFTTLYHFSGADGENPGAGVIQGSDGRLYGTTTNGGAFGFGTAFVLSVTGELRTMHDFTSPDGGNPITELIQANDGAFYGVASTGGPDGNGVIFRIRLGTPPPPTGEFFEIVSRNSGKCLDVFGASTDAGASVIQWICHGGANQQWQLEPAGGGAVRIIARHSGLALDVFGALLDDVTPIIQWPVHGGDNQVWTLQPAGDGYVSLIAGHSGKALDVEFASTDDGARVIQYLPHGDANQQWLLRPVASTGASVTTPSAR